MRSLRSLQQDFDLRNRNLDATDAYVTTAKLAYLRTPTPKNHRCLARAFRDLLIATGHAHSIR